MKNIGNSEPSTDRLQVRRHNLSFEPDATRVVERFFYQGPERGMLLLQRILAMSDVDKAIQFEKVKERFGHRHRNFSKKLLSNCKRFLAAIDQSEILDSEGEETLQLIGAYNSMEYSLESAALFNPSIIRSPDQSFLAKGETRVILSFRATGEGHLSSIVFRSGVLDGQGNLEMYPVKRQVDTPELVRKKTFNRNRFFSKASEMGIAEHIYRPIMDSLNEQFEYHELRNHVQDRLGQMDEGPWSTILRQLLWLEDSYYDIQFESDSDISERAIFPSSPMETNGIEDARFVTFTEDNGDETIYAAYTAYDGRSILPKLLQTADFRNFRIMPMHGNGVQNKNFALFPNRINGKYAVLARVDGFNNYIMFSERPNQWGNPVRIQEPYYPWELVQLGNCGSPIRTNEGWLVLTHGVGPFRSYAIGAVLLDLEDPTKIVGRLSRPLIEPLESEREGYVPNVVYSCGGLVHNDVLVIPYALSDYASSYATLPLASLLGELRK